MQVVRPMIIFESENVFSSYFLGQGEQTNAISESCSERFSQSQSEKVHSDGVLPY